MQIAEELGVTDRTVRTYLKARPCARKKPVQPSKLDPFKAFLEQQLERNPSYNGELLYERIVAGQRSFPPGTICLLSQISLHDEQGDPSLQSS